MRDAESPGLKGEEENDPFLPPEEPQNAASGRPSESRRFRIIVIAFIFVFFIEAGITMIVAPMTRIQESIECRNFYLKNDPSAISGDGEIPEELCKNEQIQSELALIRGLSELFDGLVGVISMAAEFVSTAGSAFLMKFSPWIAWFGGGITITLGAATAFLIPETLNLFPSSEKPSELLSSRNSLSDPSEFEMSSIDSTDSLDKIDAPLPTSPIPSHFNTLPLTTRLGRKLAFYRRESSFIFNNQPVLILLLTFFVYKISRGAASFFIQYVSTRYSWTLANANYLVSMRSFLNIVVFTALLPWATWYLTNKKGLPSRAKDFLLAKLSVLALLLGTVGIGLSASIPPLVISIVMQTCGMGFAYLIRSIITTMVEPKQVARLYVGITILETLGGLAAAPLAAVLFRWGLELGGMWLGLPHMVTGVIFAITAGGVWWVAAGQAERGLVV
ncbi:MAG: hypothetical protein Q9227_006161 [Pyrenula ochraceoflavens]